MAKFRADKDPLKAERSGPRFSVRFLLALVLMAGGVAWVAYFWFVVRVDPTQPPPGEPGGPAFMGDLGRGNYGIGIGALLLGLAVSAHPSTPLGRGRGVVAGMVGCFIAGLIWICTFYLFTNTSIELPVLGDLDQWNLIIGIGFMAVGFVFATHWE